MIYSKKKSIKLTRNYREAYSLFAYKGILFNYELHMRGFEFVTREIASTAAKIKLRLASELRLENIETKQS